MQRRKFLGLVGLGTAALFIPWRLAKAAAQVVAPKRTTLYRFDCSDKTPTRFVEILADKEICRDQEPLGADPVVVPYNNKSIFLNVRWISEIFVGGKTAFVECGQSRFEVNDQRSIKRLEDAARWRLKINPQNCYVVRGEFDPNGTQVQWNVT